MKRSAPEVRGYTFAARELALLLEGKLNRRSLLKTGAVTLVGSMLCPAIVPSAPVYALTAEQEDELAKLAAAAAVIIVTAYFGPVAGFVLGGVLTASGVDQHEIVNLSQKSINQITAAVRTVVDQNALQEANDKLKGVSVTLAEYTNQTDPSLKLKMLADCIFLLNTEIIPTVERLGGGGSALLATAVNTKMACQLELSKTSSGERLNIKTMASQFAPKLRTYVNNSIDDCNRRVSSIQTQRLGRGGRNGDGYSGETYYVLSDGNRIDLLTWSYNDPRYYRLIRHRSERAGGDEYGLFPPMDKAVELRSAVVLKLQQLVSTTFGNRLLETANNWDKIT